MHVVCTCYAIYRGLNPALLLKACLLYALVTILGFSVTLFHQISTYKSSVAEVFRLRFSASASASACNFMFGSISRLMVPSTFYVHCYITYKHSSSLILYSCFSLDTVLSLLPPQRPRKQTGIGRNSTLKQDRISTS